MFHTRVLEMTKTGRAYLVWQTLFVENTPLSEAARGIISVLERLAWTRGRPILMRPADSLIRKTQTITLIGLLEIACLSDVVMTNDPFNEREEFFLSNARTNLTVAFRLRYGSTHY